jgi:hypothetical protein
MSLVTRHWPSVFISVSVFVWGCAAVHGARCPRCTAPRCSNRNCNVAAVPGGAGGGKGRGAARQQCFSLLLAADAFTRDAEK